MQDLHNVVDVGNIVDEAIVKDLNALAGSDNQLNDAHDRHDLVGHLLVVLIPIQVPVLVVQLVVDNVHEERHAVKENVDVLIQRVQVHCKRLLQVNDLLHCRHVVEFQALWGVTAALGCDYSRY